MTPSELAALIQGQIDDARRYVDDELSTDRRKALEFVRGEIDLQAERGKSSVTSRDLSDVLGWIMPSLLRQFLGSDRVVLYEPRKREMSARPKMGPDGQPVVDPQTGQPALEEVDLGKQRADQATDYVNYVFLNDCDGYRVLASAFYDGLLLGNGIVKHWWDATPEYRTETHRGLTDDQLAELLMGVEQEDVLAHSAQGAAAEFAPMDAADGVLAAPPVVLSHDITIRRQVSAGKLCVEALAPEDFLIERNSRKLDETCLGCGHRYRRTRSQLVEMGFDPATIDDLPTAAVDHGKTTALSRDGRSLKPSWHGGQDRSTEEVDIVEWYPLVDYDGDGIAERLKVLKADRHGEEGILSIEPWDDDLPFSDVVPDPIPHQWKGKSLFEELYDIQRVKTALLRQTQDNLYQVNNPMNAILENSVLNMDVLINRELGGNVFVKQPNAVTPLEVPFTADKSFQMLDYWDRVIERRGFSFASGTLDMDALTRQTATGVNAIQQAAAVKPEVYARNMAEVGLRRLFKCLLRLITKHQDKARTIRLRGKWVEADPTAWDPDMDVSINTGLGSGSRERDAAALMAVAQKQELILQTMGISNPVVTLEQYRNTLAKGCEALGLRGPEQYFAEVTQEQVAALANQPPPPDPKVIEAQGRMQLEQAKAAHQAQLKEAEAVAEHQRRMAEIEAQTMAARERSALELQTERDKAAILLRMEREKLFLNAELKREELQLEAELKREQMKIDVRQPQAANIEEARPQ